MSKLTGKTAIVTGAGRGIGREVAFKLASEGARVVVNDLDADPAHETIESIRAQGGAAVPCVGSVTATDFAERLQRSGNQGLPVHFLFEEAAEVGPDLVLGHDLSAALILQRACHIPVLRPEQHVLLLLEPGGEVTDHVEQDLVTVGDEHGAGIHASRALLAATSSCGFTPSVSATASRSGS